VVGTATGNAAGVTGSSVTGPGGQFSANATRGALNLPVVTTLPSTPIDGDIVLLKEFIGESWFVFLYYHGAGGWWKLQGI
jgi:hypothetical protein